MWQTVKNIWPNMKTKLSASGGVKKGVTIFAVAVIVINLILGFLWGSEPDLFNVNQLSIDKAANANQDRVIGYTTTATLIEITDIMLTKPGGYQSNDVMPPTVLMDNIPAWEFGVLVQIRDLAAALRNQMSRSQSQSIEDSHLQNAEPNFNVDNGSWIFPTSEREYEKGMVELEAYLANLADVNNPTAQFYARADNLYSYLEVVQSRLGSLSQQLSASVGQKRVNTDLANAPDSEQATPTSKNVVAKTPYFEIDDVFYEARGTTWALIHILKAVEIDFKNVLEKKEALASLQQIIRELEATQQTVWSPMILNGGGFGMLANHSLVMANYISRANAAIIDLNQLLQNG